MRDRTEAQLQREIRRLKMEIRAKDVEIARLEKTNRKLTWEANTNKDEIQACEDRISELENQL